MTDYTPPTWEAGVMPTPVEVLAYVRAARDDEVLLLLDGLLSSSEVAHRCMVSDHDHGMRELAARTADATRWAILRDYARTGAPDESIGAKAAELLEGDDTP